MAHHLERKAYSNLIQRLNRFPQGAPPSETLYQILATLFDEREAELVSLLPIRPFKAEKAAAAWRMDIKSARKILDELASRAILVDIEKNGDYLYCLPPPMAGFFEFSMMRLRNDINQKVLSELFYQYINTEEDFIRALILDGETPLGRIFVQERALPEEGSIHVIDYERASEVIRTASHIGVSICYCRHKMSHMEKACEGPLDICMTFNTSASSLIRHGHARPVEASECMDLLGLAQSKNLVQFGENVRKNVNFICNCCGCCCEALLAIQRFGLVRPIHSNFIVEIEKDLCSGCGKCSEICPVDALEMQTFKSEKNKPRKRAYLDEKMCLGCGVCVKNCPTGALSLKSRPNRVITPVDTTHRTVMMALERGTLQNLIFDNQTMLSHRALAAFFGAILKLSPVKRTLANSQLKSRYLEVLIERFG